MIKVDSDGKRKREYVQLSARMEDRGRTRRRVLSMRQRIKLMLLKISFGSLLNSRCTCMDQMKIYHNYDSEKKLYFYSKEDGFAYRVHISIYDEETQISMWDISSKFDINVVKTKDLKIYYGEMFGEHIYPERLRGEEKAKPLKKGKEYLVSLFYDGHKVGHLTFIYDPPD